MPSEDTDNFSTSNPVNTIAKPDHWRDLLEGHKSTSSEKPRFFKLVMNTEKTANEVAESTYAMNGVFTYDE